MGYRTIYTTARDEAEAMLIAETLVEEKMAACANVIPSMRSVYRWHGRVEQNDEFVVLLKTTASLAEKVVDRVKELHSYTVPCVVSWEIKEGNHKYLDWIESETVK
ncbi:divalent-cation tolerance protein CutA [Leptospira semungkisensis]|uniref:Divalent-cation tolerance protein CutA n=1 Tax=Leptospira semungkisensis TaxID=2484985 RepID=A0A4R9G618_9LEPT|nr:divalent-cation tolerance protein CutA [Leptospira semungkisensis]TGK06853.1 divalent-cation tolerance protein CutA [Leptospira semungkisensis]